MKAITCEYYLEVLKQKFFFEVPLEEMVRGGAFSAIDLFRLMKHQADVDEVVLIDQDEWDYEQVFDTMYAAKEIEIKS